MKLWQRRTIGILSLGGGAVGLAAAFGLLLSRTNPLEWVFCIGFMALYAWGMWSGMRLLESRTDAERSVIKYWLVQIPAFGSPLFGYAMSSGFHLTATLQFAPLNLNANFLLGSSFTYSLLQGDKPWFIGCNLFALALVAWMSADLRRTESVEKVATLQAVEAVFDASAQ